MARDRMTTVEDVRSGAAEAIRKVRTQVQWKPGKDVPHLRKRQAKRHLPAGASIGDYNAIIRSVVHDPGARVFLYRRREEPYVADRANVAGRSWLAIFSLAGIMEAAFPPTDVDGYMAQPGFTDLGTVDEVLR